MDGFLTGKTRQCELTGTGKKARPAPVTTPPSREIDVPGMKRWEHPFEKQVPSKKPNFNNFQHKYQKYKSQPLTSNMKVS